MAEPVTLAALFAAAGAAFLATHRRDRARVAVWQEVADELDATLWTEPDGLGVFFTRVSMVVQVAGAAVPAEVRIELIKEGHGKHSVKYCRGSVVLPLGSLPVFSVHRQGLLSSVQKKLGLVDVELGGHRAFDAQFVVNAEDDGRLRAMWTDEAKQLMLMYLPNHRIDSDGTTISFQETDLFFDPIRLKAAIRLLSILAGCDVHGIAALRSVEGAAYEVGNRRSDGSFAPFIALDVPNRVTIGPESYEGRYCTVARLPGQVRAADCSVEVPSTELEAQLARLPGATRTCLRRCGRGRLVIHAGRAHFAWDQVATNPAEMLEAAKALSALMSAGESPLR